MEVVATDYYIVVEDRVSITLVYDRLKQISRYYF